MLMLFDCITLHLLAHVCVYVISECTPTQRVPSTLPSLAGWQGGLEEKVGPSQPACAAAQMEVWLEGLLLPLALDAPAGDLKNAQLCR